MASDTYGTVEVNGKLYTKRPQVFTFPKLAFPSNGTAVDNSSRLVLPGVAPFMLYGLGMETLVAGAPAVRRFLWRFGNSDGSIYYAQGGLGGNTDLVLSSLCFGNAQFPFALPAPIVYGASANIPMQFQDVSNQTGTYDIYIAFYGVYLLQA